LVIVNDQSSAIHSQKEGSYFHFIYFKQWKQLILCKYSCGATGC
jgi:hypothetical protein